MVEAANDLYQADPAYSALPSASVVSEADPFQDDDFVSPKSIRLMPSMMKGPGSVKNIDPIEFKVCMSCNLDLSEKPVHPALL